MEAVPSVFATLHAILVVSFVAVTALLLLVTTVNWLRVRQPLMSWRPGSRFRLPAWPLAFLGAVLVLFGCSVAIGAPLSLPVLSGYLLGGSFWLLAATFSTATIVTEYGLLTSVNRLDEAVAWRQVVDYFETVHEGSLHVVFFYLDGASRRQRFELAVPPAQHEAFRSLVDRKLAERFDAALEKSYGNKALEG